MISKDSIAGAPLWYERESSHGHPKTFEFDSKFYRTLEEGFLEIAEAFKPLSRVILGGVYVDKPGAHKLARAADLDGIEFEDGQIWMATERSRLSAAIQGVFMKRFGVVLGWTYDRLHWDHFHVADTSPWGFYVTRSVVTYIQWVLGFEGHSLLVDGIWGPKTESAFWLNFGRLNGKGYPTDAEYKTFLNFAISKFFNQMKRESDDPDSPNNWNTPAADPRMEALEKIRDLAAAALQEGVLEDALE